MINQDEVFVITEEDILKPKNDPKSKSNGKKRSSPLSFSRNKTSVEVAEQLARQAGILAIPGEYFGAGHTQFLRFAFANADAATIRQLRGRMIDFSI